MYRSATETQTAAEFAADTAGHRLEVLHEEGLYRHLHCSAGGRIAQSFSIITAPGVLTFTGDRGHYVFAGHRDMLACFDDESVNVSYWVERFKACDIARPLREFSAEALAQSLEDAIAGDDEIDEDTAAAARAEILGAADAQDAQERAEDFTCNGATAFPDVWEWDHEDYTPDTYWCRYALQWAVARYRAHQVHGAGAGRDRRRTLRYPRRRDYCRLSARPRGQGRP
ncbi:hypothetical protein GCM10011374_30210 [Kocuria dechangensis]|uniref:Uncharacterized protein n=1 Tax=Kocuria dechangensis TaxID=1176249 RepID=A0A917H1U8_9MICC|nr:hypothetical protein [Kocuria dechangensis]GGG64531.1 hypothetical protein GCM10011374_30210 [Kocuria dechangensis]